jgi:nucleoid DNA-binding protein
MSFADLTKEQLAEIRSRPRQKRWGVIKRRTTALTQKQVSMYISDLTGYTKAEVDLFIDAWCALMHHELSNNRRVVLPGIGRLTPTRIDNRVFYDIQTEDKVFRPSWVVVKFKAGAELKATFRNVTEEIVLGRWENRYKDVDDLV